MHSAHHCSTTMLQIRVFKHSAGCVTKTHWVQCNAMHSHMALGDTHGTSAASSANSSAASGAFSTDA